MDSCQAGRTAASRAVLLGSVSPATGVCSHKKSAWTPPLMFHIVKIQLVYSCHR